jgi:hypothetical protein
METLRQGPRVAVPSTVTNGKWWVFSETKSDMYAIGYIHQLATEECVAWQIQMVDGRKRSYLLGESVSLIEALKLFREL